MDGNRLEPARQASRGGPIDPGSARSVGTETRGFAHEGTSAARDDARPQSGLQGGDGGLAFGKLAGGFMSAPPADANLAPCAGEARRAPQRMFAVIGEMANPICLGGQPRAALLDRGPVAARIDEKRFAFREAHSFGAAEHGRLDRIQAAAEFGSDKRRACCNRKVLECLAGARRYIRRLQRDDMQPDLAAVADQPFQRDARHIAGHNCERLPTRRESLEHRSQPAKFRNDLIGDQDENIVELQHRRWRGRPEVLGGKRGIEGEAFTDFDVTAVARMISDVDNAVGPGMLDRFGDSIGECRIGRNSSAIKRRSGQVQR